jgi:alkylated DNA nucleotide flippase Atl1
MINDADNAVRLLDELEKGLIPFGKLSTYKSIGKVLGIGPREVGVACRILGECSEAKQLPYHRIVRQNGWLPSWFSAGGKQRHIELLEQEGHKVKQVGENYRVSDFEDCLRES